MRLIAGVDVGGTTLKLALFEPGGKLLTKWEVKTPAKEEAETLIPLIADSVLKKMAEEGYEREMLAAVGMGMPGPVREDGYLPWLVNLGVGGMYPAQALSAILGVPSVAANDGNLAAFGEAKYGAAKGRRSVVMLTLGTGVGGGVIVDGKIVTGIHGVAGEIGHFVVNPHEKTRCNCGNCGCLEQYASATGLVRNAQKLLSTSAEASILRAKDAFTAKDVCEAAKQGDPIALQALDVLGRYLGIAIAHLMLTTDPEAVVLGGGVSKAGEILLRAIGPYVDAYTHIAERHGEIVTASLQNDGGIFGAAALAEELIETR